jgi:hypothetical protein
MTEKNNGQMKRTTGQMSMIDDIHKKIEQHELTDTRALITNIVTTRTH